MVAHPCNLCMWEARSKVTTKSSRSACSTQWVSGSQSHIVRLCLQKKREKKEAIYVYILFWLTFFKSKRTGNTNWFSIVNGQCGKEFSISLVHVICAGGQQDGSAGGSTCCQVLTPQVPSPEPTWRRENWLPNLVLWPLSMGLGHSCVWCMCTHTDTQNKCFKITVIYTE